MAYGIVNLVEMHGNREMDVYVVADHTSHGVYHLGRFSDVFSAAAKIDKLEADKPFINAYRDRVATQAEVDASMAAWRSDEAYDNAIADERERFS